MTWSGRLVVALGAAVVVAGLGLLAFGRPGTDDPREYRAMFTSARGLVAGNDVRVDGAIAGSVRSVELARSGRAEVTFRLDDEVRAPRADAAAAIRPVDLLGDTYLALSPGRARTALAGAIPAARTSNAPRLDELLRTFSPPVRDGMQALLVEGGLALDRRGADLAAASVKLEPALEAADRVADELDAQDGALATLVTRADRAVAQLDGRRADLGPLVDDLATTLRATAGERGALDPALQRMPQTLAQLRATATRLQGTATAATPLAEQVRDVAPALTAAATGLAPLLQRAQRATPGLVEGLGAARELLTDGSPGLGAVAQALQDLTAAAPDTGRLLEAVSAAAPGISQGFLVNFPDQAAEPGRQPLDPFADDRRHYWRGAAVFSCEAFGVRVKPGCLDEVLGGGGTSATAKRGGKAADPAAAAAPQAAAPAPQTPGAGDAKPDPAKPVRDLLPQVLQGVGGLLGGNGSGGTGGGSAPAQPAASSQTPVDDLLDLLLGS